jgi:hypothetical protein
VALLLQVFEVLQARMQPVWLLVWEFDAPVLLLVVALEYLEVHAVALVKPRVHVRHQLVVVLLLQMPAWPSARPSNRRGRYSCAHPSIVCAIDAAHDETDSHCLVAQ